LERDGFISRHITEDVPPKVDYSLTELGIDLTERVQELINWLEEKSQVIEGARNTFDEEN
jgi:DNA-binding HxlR family transcriptional regulator